MKFQLSQNSWNGEKSVDITLPDSWDVTYLESKIDTLTPLTPEQLREKFDHAYGTQPLLELARGKKEVVILFDDLTRGTPTQPVAEIILDILALAGVPKTSIRFLCALGAHGPLSRRDFCEKLGERILEEYPVYNHNPYENCREIGITSEGVPIQLNEEFLSCDLKIGIGGLVPHPLNGFGGGGKIVMPGVASMETIRGTHTSAVEINRRTGANPMAASGSLSNPAFRSQVEEITRMCGFDFKIDVLMNTRKEIIDLFMGDPIEEYYAGAKAAEDLYYVSPSNDNDVAIVNANAKGGEASIAYFTGMMALKPEGGDIVLVNHVPNGQAVHYLFGAFGKTIGGQMWTGVPDRLPMVNRLIVYSPYPDYSSAEWFCKAQQLIWAKTWEEVQMHLSSHGTGTKAVVFADGTIQHIRR